MAHVVGVKPQALVGGVQPASSKSVPHQQHRSAMQCQAAQRPVEVSICTNKTCKKQGSKQILQFVQDLHLDNVTIQETGCLANCGSGPNVAVSPPDVVLNHMGTVARFSEALRTVCGADVSPDVLRATELRLAGNAQARQGDLDAACASYTEALGLDTPYGRHLLLANRSGARLQLGDSRGALQDADAAAECGPPSFHTAIIRQVEAHAAMQDYAAAAEALQKGGSRDAAFTQTKDYKSLRKQLEKLVPQAAGVR